MFNGILWIAKTGSPWRDLPLRFGPWETVYSRFRLWSANEVLKGLFEHLTTDAGITKQELSTKLYQHNYGEGGKGLDYLQEMFSGLTRNQARAIEQYFIENGPGNAMNRINSISPTSPYYNDALNWATEFISNLK